MMRFFSRDEPQEINSSIVGLLAVDLDELAFLANVIYQSRLAIEDWEFSALVGLEPNRADEARRVIIDALRAHQPPQT